MEPDPHKSFLLCGPASERHPLALQPKGELAGDLIHFKTFDVTTLILHGGDDQIVPIGAAALRSSKLVKNATLKIQAGAPHGLADTHKDQLSAGLLAFPKT